MNRFDLESYSDEKVKEIADTGNFTAIFEYGMRLYNLEKYREAFSYLYRIKDYDNFFVWERIIDIAYYYEKDLLSDKEIFDLLIKRHCKGSGSYSYLLAHFYKDGRGVEKNMDKYIELLTICYHDGSSYAAAELAKCYEEGIGVKQSFEKAFDVYFNFIDDHYRMDYFCAYQAALYMLEEKGGAKRDMPCIERHLRYASRIYKEAKKLYIELFGKEPD